MAYRLKKREPVADALRRVAASQLTRAAQELASDAHPHAAIHDARVRIKRVRALLALAEPSMTSQARHESHALRDIADSLAAPRDAASILEAFALLRARFGEVDPEAFAAIQRWLVRDPVLTPPDEPPPAAPAPAALAPDASPTALLLASEQLSRAAARAAGWDLEAKGFAILRPGLHATYARVRRDRREALASQDPRVRHAWRIGVKRLTDQLRLLRVVWPEALDPHVALLRQIARGLGQDHDLWLLAVRLRAMPDRFGEPRSVLAIARLADRAARETVKDLRAPARLALAEKPGAFVSRIESLWRAWRRQ